MAAAAAHAPPEHPEPKESLLTSFYDYLANPRIKVNPFQGKEDDGRKQRFEENKKWNLEEQNDDKDVFLRKLEQLEISESNLEVIKRIGLGSIYERGGLNSFKKKPSPLIEGIRNFNLHVGDRYTPVKRGVLFEEIDKSIAGEAVEVPVAFLRWCRKEVYGKFTASGGKRMDTNVLIAKIGTPLLHDWYGAALDFERNQNKSYSMVLKITGDCVVSYRNTPQIYTDVYNVEVSSLPFEDLSVYAVKNKTEHLIEAIFGYRGKFSPGYGNAYDDVDTSYDDITRITRKDRYDIVKFFIAYVMASENSVKSTEAAVAFLQTEVNQFIAREKDRPQYSYWRKSPSSRKKNPKYQSWDDWVTKDMLYHFSRFLKVWYESEWSEYTSIMNKYFEKEMGGETLPFFPYVMIAKYAGISPPEWVSHNYEKILEEQRRYERGQEKRQSDGQEQLNPKRRKTLPKSVLFI